jgi:hypothetical protein
MDICNGTSGILRPGTVVKSLATAYYSGEHIGLSVLQLRRDAAYLLVTRAKGGPLRLAAVALGAMKVCVLPLDLRNNNVSWTAYDAAGHLLDSGSVSKLIG